MRTPRRQLCQWSRLAHKCLQSASISGGIPVFDIKTDGRDDLVKNTKLNPNNYCH